MTRTRWVWRGVQLVVLAVVVWGVYRALAPELAKVTRADFSRYRPSWLLLALSTALLLSMYVLHALLWRAITAALARTRVELGPAFRVYFLSSLGRYIPGKLWQLTGMAVLAQRAGISPVAATAAALLAQLAFLSMGMVFLAALLPALYGPWALLGALVLVSTAIAVFILSDTERGAAMRHRLLHRLGPRFAEAGTLLDQLTPRRAAVWWLIYGLSWVLLGGAFALFVSAFVPQQAGHYRHFAGTAAASYMAGLILLMPAGLGTREASIVLLLTPVISAPAALIVSVASRVWYTVAELLPLALIPLLDRGVRVKEGPA